MSARPDVSVVIATYNGLENLARSIESVLYQKGVRLEFILVDDGSTDDSIALLDRYAASDTRVRVLHQEHLGLTRALVKGCALALGEYIARQDVGDVSLAGRLREQHEYLTTNPNAVLVSCGTRFVGPAGEHLFDMVQDDETANNGLRTLEARRLAGPSHHGSTFFRRSAYQRVGGYREEFYFAQDIDLWARLAEIGAPAAIPKILYQAVVGPDSVSTRHRREQLALTRLIVEAMGCRRAGLSEAAVLQKAVRIRPRMASPARRAARSRALYFIGACLRRRGDRAAADYFRLAVRENPLHFKAWYRLLAAH